MFAFLHQSILRGGYSLQASDLRQAFDHGRFNCVTASLLFNCLAERFELKAVALEIPGHAMSRLELPGETLDIETTCPRWFCAGRPAWRCKFPPGWRSDAGGSGDGGSGRTGRAGAWPASASTERRPLRQVSEVELVATIYYNRGVDLLAEKQFADGGGRQCQGRAARSGKRDRQRQFSRHDQQLGHRSGHVGRI